MKESIQFQKIAKWIIVHDSDKNAYTLESHPQIIEVFHRNTQSKAGHAQRNLGITLIPKTEDTLVYFLDDDNVMHPDFFAQSFTPSVVTTFDQIRDRSGRILKGNELKNGFIDTAMMVFPIELFRSWRIDCYSADGMFADDLYNDPRTRHIYIPKSLCYYNKLR